jgi:hypothetical protein
MDEPSPPSASAPTRRDRLLVTVFWVWAAVLVVATIGQLFRIQPILDVLDVKNWFAR